MKLIPHILTSLRLLAAPAVAWLIISGRYQNAVGVLAFAGVTDWFDGAAARALKVSGKVGVILDPLADKIMLVTLYLALGYARVVPLFLLALVVGRDLVIVVGVLLLRIFRGARKFKPSLSGKVSTFFQIVYALLALLRAAWPYRWIGFLEGIGLILAAIFTVVSGAGYVRLGIRMARREIPAY